MTMRLDDREWARLLDAANPLPAALVDERPDPQQPTRWFAWADRCRAWWAGCDLPEHVVDTLWAGLIAERLRLANPDWPRKRAPRYPDKIMLRMRHDCRSPR